MLIFWRHIYSDDIFEYLTDHCNPTEDCYTLRLSNFTATHVLTSGDRLANYSVGLVMVAAFLISSALNPLVFYHFWRESSSSVIVDILFRILAASDFLTNLYSPLYYAHQLFTPEIQATVKTTWGFVLAQAISCNLGCISQSATTLLAVARFIRIRSPFININKHLFLFVFTAYFTVMTGITIAGKYYLLAGIHPATYSTLADICFYLNLVQCFVGVIFAVLCISSLFKLRPQSGEELAMKTYRLRRKGCVTILLINLPYLVSLCFASTAAITQYKHLRALNFTFLPVITSAINPVIISARNSGIKKRLDEMRRKLQERLAIRGVSGGDQPSYTPAETMMSAVLLDEKRS